MTTFAAGFAWMDAAFNFFGMTTDPAESGQGPDFFANRRPVMQATSVEGEKATTEERAPLEESERVRIDREVLGQLHSDGAITSEALLRHSSENAGRAPTPALPDGDEDEEVVVRPPVEERFEDLRKAMHEQVDRAVNTAVAMTPPMSKRKRSGMERIFSEWDDAKRLKRVEENAHMMADAFGILEAHHERSCESGMKWNFGRIADLREEVRLLSVEAAGSE